MIFYRFGEIPKNEKSCIWRGEEKIGEEKAISRSAVLDQRILDQINFAIIKEASKGNRRANITLIHKA